MVREKIGLQTDGQTDGHGDNISVFFPMRKKALITNFSLDDSSGLQASSFMVVR